MGQNVLHYGLLSLLPALVALGLAIWSKRVIESLLAGIFSAVLITDGFVNGIGHSLVYSIPNLFRTIVGHPGNSAAGLSGTGILKGADRPQVLLVVLLLGAFITLLDKSGGALAFGEWLSSKVKGKKGAQNSTAVMGCMLFTSAYFSSLATGAVFRPIYDRLKISREKLAFILDSTSAPINVLIPFSGWVAYMGSLMADNIPGVNNGIWDGLVKTIPFNFYCIVILIIVFLLANGKFKDFGPMKKAEEKVLTGTSNYLHQEVAATTELKNGSVSDMILPLGISIIALVALGLWNYTLASPAFQLGFKSIPMGGNEILLISFSLGIIVAFVKYVAKGLMTATEFLNEASEGSKSAIFGGMIIILAVTLGDLLRAAAPEGLGGAQYIQAIAADVIPQGIIPFATFILASFMGFAMGTSWGVWGIMMPIAIPLALAVGGNPFVVAAAVLSGGTFGDHCSPISDTTIMSSLGAGCDHMDHVNTQLPYALLGAGVSSVLFLIAGFIF